MQQVEYKVEDVKEKGNASLEAQLNIRAQEGWRLAFVIKDDFLIFEKAAGAE